jgi:hypothetical protein
MIIKIFETNVGEVTLDGFAIKLQVCSHTFTFQTIGISEPLHASNCQRSLLLLGTKDETR